MSRRIKPPEILRSIKRLLTRENFSEQDLVFKLFSKTPPGERESRILFDVGAHYGISMLKFARSGWKVYCFEPDDKNRSILEKTIADNHLNNVEVDCRALSDAEKRSKYYSSDISSGISSLISFHPSHKEEKEVEVITLSSFCSKNHIEKIDFLKTDTEGNDLPVIKGLDLKNIRPKIILCEYEDAKTTLIGYTKEDMIRYLEEYGYKCFISEWYPVIEYGIRHRWKKITDDISLVDDNSWGNIIAADSEFYRPLKNRLERSFKYRKNIRLTGNKI